MASYYRVYASTADAGVFNPSTSTYSTARAATTATSTAITTTDVGQQFSTPNYFCNQYFAVFDTTSVPSDKTIGRLTFTTNARNAGNQSDLLEVRAVSSAANKIAGASLASQTPLFGSGAQPATVVPFYIPLDITSMARASTCIMLVHSQNERLNVAPTAQEATTIYLADSSGTVNDPYLDVVPAAPWQFIGVTTAAAVAATPLVLTEPAGVADGDLLIATIASRTTATTAVTASGWTAVGSQNNNNTLTTTSALGSGTMLYQIRSGTPTLSFTLPATVSVALGRIIAYRGSATAALVDATTAVTTATATTAISVTGLTTTQDDDLIVAMVAGGQEATVTDFNNVTTPIGSSGSDFGSTRAPGPLWQDRGVPSTTTTGADTSLATFDAVRSAAGATGNLTATASLGAGHVVIAGAFKILPAAATSLVPIDPMAFVPFLVR